MNKVIRWFKINSLLLLSCIWIMTLLWFYREALSTKVDVAYLDNLYGTSQWMKPLSQRIMADDQLYLLAGWKLAHGASPFSINPEAPPLGKYIYGWSMVIFSRPWIWNVIAYILIVSIILWLAKHYFITINQREPWRWQLVGFLCATSPLLYSQIQIAMLDLTQLLWMVLFVAAIESGLRTSGRETRYLSLITAGASMACFSTTKIPFFAIPMGGVSCLVWYLVYKRQKWTLFFDAIIFGCSLIVVYMTTYMQLWASGKHLVDFLSAQKWVIHFYATANTGAFWWSKIMAIITLLTGWFDGLSGNWKYVNEWTPLLAAIGIIMIVLTIKTIYIFIRNKRIYTVNTSNYFDLLTISIWLTFFFVSFYPRYLLLLLPWGMMILVRRLGGQRTVLSIIIISHIIFVLFALFPHPRQDVEYALTDWKKFNFHDMYFYLDNTSRKNYSWQLFQLEMKNNMVNMQVNKLTFAYQLPRIVWPWQHHVEVPITIEYQLPFTVWRRQTSLSLKRMRDHWRIVWKPDYVAENFQLGNKLITTVLPSRQGDLVDNLGVRRSWAVPQRKLIVDKEKMIANNEEERVQQIIKRWQNNQSDTNIEQRLWVDSESVPTVDFIEQCEEGVCDKINLFNLTSLKITNDWTMKRQYFTTDGKYSIDFLKQQERAHSELFGKDGGIFVMQQGENEIILINQIPIQGKDIVLSQ